MWNGVGDGYIANSIIASQCLYSHPLAGVLFIFSREIKRVE
ncbi:hypothetical protein EV13_2130 [Prochlorococcus sp. MIT 0702]|nr:hypothetical protein EV13_2130 [Prochlorococcus sp. MIT 0702]KGG27680.1 hypothetical protein EV12_1110 [Prochlorococcus sp. MIT 0701]KGG31919.1 hypothetical protein EV14_2127 [Prochlorococcus sp. MIT 0703]